MNVKWTMIVRLVKNVRTMNAKILACESVVEVGQNVKPKHIKLFVTALLECREILLYLALKSAARLIQIVPIHKFVII